MSFHIRRLMHLLPKIFALSLLISIVSSTSSFALTNLLPNDTDPTYLGIGWYPNFDGKAAQFGVYYDTWNSANTINIESLTSTVYFGANCQNPDPDVYFASPPGFNETEAYVTVQLAVANGTSLTYRINRTNFCQHRYGGPLNGLNLRTALADANFVGRYQLPVNDPATLAKDAETGKYKVTVSIGFTGKVTQENPGGDYNPNAYFRVRSVTSTGSAIGLVGAIGSDETSLKKVNTRVYTDTEGFRDQTIEFGSPCDLVPGSVARIGLYDPDNYQTFPTTPSGTQGGGGGRPLVFYVEELPLGGSSYAPLASSAYSFSTAGRAQKTTRETLISRGFSTNLPTGITAIEPITERPFPDTTNSLSALANFTPKLGAKYRLRLIDVFTINFLQVVVPYDGIYSNIDCSGLSGEVNQSIQLDPNIDVVETGQPIRARFLGSSTAPFDVPVNYTGRIWYDRTDNGAFDGGDLSVINPSGSGTLTAGVTNQEFINHLMAADIAQGGRICFYWSITPTNPLVTDADPTADVRCVYIGFSPKTNVWGNDIRVGSGRVISGNVPSMAMGKISTIWEAGVVKFSGSWAEYGIFAPRSASASLAKTSVTALASGSGLVFDSPTATSNQSDWSKLTFANSYTAGNPATTNCLYGCFGTPDAMGTIPDIEQYVLANGLVDGSDITVTANEYTITGNLAPLPAGRQRIIIAETIKIKPNVSEVNAWLVARQGVYTCDKSASSTRIGDCDTPLRINGPIFAQSLSLDRVGNPTIDKRTIGETINLRGDAFIWAYKTTRQGGSYQTTGLKELPPRY